MAILINRTPYLTGPRIHLLDTITGTPSPHRGSHDEDDLTDEHEERENVFLDEDARENNPFRASPQNSRRGSQSLYASFERAARLEADENQHDQPHDDEGEEAEDEEHDPYDSQEGDMSDDLDIGSHEYDSQVEERFAQGHAGYDDPSDDSEDSYERAARLRRQKREAKELKREQEQLGFIKQLTNFLRKQRDDLGWGTPQKQNASGDDDDDEGEDEKELDLNSDADRYLTSARTRRGSPWRRERPPRRISTSVEMAEDYYNSLVNRMEGPPSPLPTLQRTLTPNSLQKKATAPEILQHRPTTPVTLQRTQTPPTLLRTRTPPTLQPRVTPPVRHRPTTPPPIPRRSITPPHLQEQYREVGTPMRRKESSSLPARRGAAPQAVGQDTTAMSSPLNRMWVTGKSWIHAGVASGLLNPGTLTGVAVLCLVVLMRSILGYDGSSGYSTGGNGGAACNDTVVPPQQQVVLRDVLSNTWDKLAWNPSQSSPTDGANTSGEQDASRDDQRGWFSRLIPQVPSISHWIPSRATESPDSKGRKKNKGGSIQIPAEEIHSLEELEARVEWIQKVLVDLGHADEQLSRDFQTKFDGMSVWIAGVEHKLTKVSQEVASLREYVQDGRWIEQTVLEWIRDEIPRHLVVSRDPRTGKLTIPGEFWDTARQLFMTPEQVEASVQEKLTKLGLDSEDDAEQEGSSTNTGGWRWRSSKKNKAAIVSWEDFLRENEKAMSDFVEGRMSRVSRAAFLNLLKTEASAIWQELEHNVMALLEKQGKLQGKNAPTRGHRSSSSSTVDHDRALSEVEQELIMGLIDEALEKFSADAIAKPDYALWSAGGRIIPMLTSPSYYQEVKPTLWGRLGLKYFVKVPRRENPVEKAIQPDVHAGECWAMEGPFGQVGIRLAREIFVTEVTIEHADHSVVLDSNSAPKEIEIWGLGNDEFMQAGTSSDILAGQQQQQQQSSSSSSQTTANTNDPQGSPWRDGIPWEGARLLTTIQYDAQSDMKPRQTFSIPLSKQNIPSIGVAVRIKSNWGHPNYTCLYRVRVHGHERTTEDH
ncbi:hypothetical protein BGX34_000253 [Mortierella sp. NVP85]|nr:hypothetical protein BGX34_000253 [Mortierella sp. NVP85]